MNKTIAQQLKVTKFPFVIKDDSGKEIYWEDSNGFWYKCEYDSIGKEIYCENSEGVWCKREYDFRGNQIYCERNTGVIFDIRPKAVPEYTMEELVTRLGHDFKIKK
jgi:hypothetical protein